MERKAVVLNGFYVDVKFVMQKLQEQFDEYRKELQEAGEDASAKAITPSSFKEFVRGTCAGVLEGHVWYDKDDGTAGIAMWLDAAISVPIEFDDSFKVSEECVLRVLDTILDDIDDYDHAEDESNYNYQGFFVDLGELAREFEYSFFDEDGEIVYVFQMTDCWHKFGNRRAASFFVYEREAEDDEYGFTLQMDQGEFCEVSAVEQIQQHFQEVVRLEIARYERLVS
ncbi:MAG: hypothetical protein ACXIU7_10990 [Roseinatronobacter sp.]